MAEEVETAGLALDPARVAELRDAGEADVIDVRRDYEFEAGHLPGARWIEVNEVKAQAGTIPKDRPAVFYCRSGNRSGMVAQAFRDAGWDAHHMAGGISAWAETGLPLEPEDGSVSEGRPPSA